MRKVSERHIIVRKFFADHKEEMIELYEKGMSSTGLNRYYILKTGFNVNHTNILNHLRKWGVCTKKKAWNAKNPKTGKYAHLK